MSELQLLMHGQRDGGVVITATEVAPDGGFVQRELVVERENVPALLLTVLNALKFGDHPPDVLQAAAMTCAAFLSPRLVVR